MLLAREKIRYEELRARFGFRGYAETENDALSPPPLDVIIYFEDSSSPLYREYYRRFGRNARRGGSGARAPHAYGPGRLSFVASRCRLAHAVTVRTGKNAVPPEANKTGRPPPPRNSTSRIPPGRRCARARTYFRKRPLLPCTQLHPCANAYVSSVTDRRRRRTKGREGGKRWYRAQIELVNSFEPRLSALPVARRV